MNTKKSTSGFLFGLTVLIGLMPLAFTFSQNGTRLLLETEFRYVVWCGQVITLLLLLLTKHSLCKNQLIGLSVFCVFVPFAFTFGEDGASFLILNKYTSSILSWAIASVLLGKLFFERNLKENPKL
jgi:hypothetical protein